MQVIFAEEPYNAAATLYIDFPDAEIGDTVSFAVVLTGTARLQRNYPAGVPRELDDGCPRDTVHGLTGYNIECVEQSYDDGLLASPQYSGIAGDAIFVDYLVANGAGRGGYLYLVFDSSFSSSRGDETYFQLPSVGSVYCPEDYRNELIVDLGRTQDYYVPNPFKFIVQYRDVPLGNHLDNVTDVPFSTRPLLWSGSNTVLAPGGVIVDSSVSSEIARRLFWLAAAVGLLVGLTPIATKAWVTAIAGWRLVGDRTGQTRRRLGLRFGPRR